MMIIAKDFNGNSSEIEIHTRVVFSLDNGKEYTISMREEGVSITETTGQTMSIKPKAANAVILD